MRGPRKAVLWVALVATAAVIGTGVVDASLGHGSAHHGRVEANPVAGPPIGAVLPARPPARAHDRRPNIVMVMTDDQRVDDMRFMPHVRRLIGRDGLTFANSFSPYPLCCPARASFLTGQYAHNHHVYDVKAPWGYRSFDDSHTLATSLHAAGYNTGFVGKYLNGYGPDRSLVSHRPSYSYVPNGWDDWEASFQDPHVRGIHGGTYNYRDTPYNVNGRVVNHFRGRYQTGVIGDFSVSMANRFAQRRTHGHRPFFMWVNYVAPHFGMPELAPAPQRSKSGKFYYYYFTPWVPKSGRGRFNKIITRPAGFSKVGPPVEPNVSDKPRQFRIGAENGYDRWALREVTRRRAESLWYVDQQVARLVRDLKRTGQWRNTVLMFTSDNGYFIGEHRFRIGKIKAYEPSLRVPFLLTGPGMRSGETRDDPISTVDITATILDLAHAKAPHPADGISVLPTLLHGDQGWKVPIVTESMRTGNGHAPSFAGEVRTGIGLRTARYSYSRYDNGASELYDLVTDPMQNTNLVHKTRYQPLVRLLRQTWLDYKDCAGASCRKPGPAELAADPAQEHRWTRDYWKVIRAHYGW